MTAYEDTPRCRGCNRILKGTHIPYWRDLQGKLHHAKPCFYGGYVCSRQCDEKACIQLESSMPGAGPAKRPGTFAMQQIRRNWDTENV